MMGFTEAVQAGCTIVRRATTPPTWSDCRRVARRVLRKDGASPSREMVGQLAKGIMTWWDDDLP
jgi:hypothetical protein